jgi:hypothetical protein
MSMQSRVLLVTRGAFWNGDVPSIRLETGDSRMSFVCETAAEVPGDRRVLMGSGQVALAYQLINKAPIPNAIFNGPIYRK